MTIAFLKLPDIESNFLISWGNLFLGQLSLVSLQPKTFLPDKFSYLLLEYFFVIQYHQDRCSKLYPLCLIQQFFFARIFSLSFP
jgi:hypothetical protein